MFKPTITAVSRSVFGCLFGATLMGSLVPEAQALATREVDFGLSSRQACIDKYGHLSYFGSDMTLASDDDLREGRRKVWCIHTVALERSDAVNNVGGVQQVANGVFTYPRDNLKLYIPISTQIHRIRVNIPGGSQGGVPAPYREMGNTFEHNLNPIGNDNGQTIWGIPGIDTVGLKIWNATSCGPDDYGYTSQSDLAVNATEHHSGMYRAGHGSYKRNTPGVAWADIGGGCNYFAHITTQVVLLKPDVVNGSITIPAQRLGRVKLQSGNFDILAGKIDFDINLAPMSFRFAPRTCSYSGPKDQTVIMKKVSVQDFFGIRNVRPIRQEVYSYNDSGKAIGNDTIEGNQFSLILNCSQDARVESYVTFTDNLNPNNTTNILTPKTGTGQAQQVGIKLYLKGREEAINFSPIAFQPGTEGTKGQAIAQSANAIRVGGRSNQAQTHRLDFTAKYARLGNRVTAGKVNAEMVFNFSYY